MLNSRQVFLPYELRENYLNFFKNIEELETVAEDSRYIKELIEKYKKDEENFRKECAGEKANVSYSKFSSLVESFNFIEAIRFYILASFFKEKYVEDQIYQAEAKFERAKEFYEKGKIIEALNTLDSIKVMPSANLKLKSLNDKVNSFRNKLLETKEKFEMDQLLWRRKEKAGYFLNFNMGGNLGFKYPLEREILLITPGLRMGNFGCSFLGAISLYKKYLLGFDLSFWYTTYSGESIDLNPWFYSFKTTERIIKSYLKFLFREEVGVRPFVNLGLGYVHLSREEFTAIRYTWKGEYGDRKIERLFPKEVYFTPQIVSEFGIEYISKTTSSFILGNKVSLSYNFKNVDAFGRVNPSFSLYIGTVVRN
ncbi:MAG: hypothetical protein ABIN61_04910 [candidate division WOR-3 bacterium]